MLVVALGVRKVAERLFDFRKAQACGHIAHIQLRRLPIMVARARELARAMQLHPKMQLLVRRL